MDESVDAYVPSKAIPQTVLMDMYGGGEVVDLKVPVQRICPASNSEWIEVTRLVLAPAYTASRPGSEDPRCSLFPNLTARKGK